MSLPRLGIGDEKSKSNVTTWDYHLVVHQWIVQFQKFNLFESEPAVLGNKRVFYDAMNFFSELNC